MKKFLIIAGILVAVVLGFRAFFMNYTKSASPESDVAFSEGNLSIHVFYNSPSKKGRVIFGGLVSYDTLWRTGANEATVFETNKDLTIQGKTLKAGKYSLWTIPGKQTWKILFNSEHGQWGIDFNGEANRDSKNDVLTAEVESLTQDKEIEKFTISVEKADEEILLILLWDKTVVTLPMTIASR
jgi:Protein of unknown function (DUF2911)